MAKGSNPFNIMFRMYTDAQRLDRWAQAHGSPKQCEFATGMLNVCLHAIRTQLYSPASITPASQPTPQRSEAYMIGLRTAGEDRVRGSTSLAPFNPDTQPKQVSDWIAGYNDYHGD